MKKITIIIILFIGLFFLTSCGKDGALGPVGSTGATGATGATGSSGVGTRVVYTGTFGTAPQEISIPDITLANLPSVEIFIFGDFYGTINGSPQLFSNVWVYSNPGVFIQESKILHVYSAYNGRPYKVVIIK